MHFITSSPQNKNKNCARENHVLILLEQVTTDENHMKYYLHMVILPICSSIYHRKYVVKIVLQALTYIKYAMHLKIIACEWIYEML